MRRMLFGFVAALACGGAPAMAQEAIHLKPSSPWLVDYADDSCRLARTFGEGEQKVTLFLDQFQPDAGFYIILGGNLMEVNRDLLKLDLKVRFGPQELEQEETAHTGAMGKLPALIVDGGQRVAPLSEQERSTRDAMIKAGGRFNSPSISAAREAAVKFLEIKGTPRDIVLETGPMDKSLGVLRECAWDTVADWGLNVQQQKTLLRGPIAIKPTEWISGDDYPWRMLRGGYQGTVNYRAIVDATGKPTSCHVQRSTRPKEFDETVCRIVMKRAKFEPALDASGRPVPSFWSQAITFRLEG